MTKRTRKKLVERLGTFVLRRLHRSLERKTPAQVERFGARVGRLLMRVDRRRRAVAEANLAMAMPELSEAERKALVPRIFEHFGIASADFLAGARRDLAELEATMEIRGLEHLEAAVAKGKGVLLITGHFGNWERGSAWLSLKGHRLNVVVRDANQEGINQFVESLRKGPGTSVIPRGNAARPMLEKLRAQEFVAILSDQNADDYFVPFFGHMAGTNLGVGVIQERTGAVALPVSCPRIGIGRYRLEFHPPLEPEPGYETKGEGLLRAINGWLEARIREHPEQWLWFHDRWRSARRRGLL